jgi:hypothetical protein
MNANIARIEKLNSGTQNFKYMTAKIKHDGTEQPFTPNAVDMIRKYVWANMDSRPRKDIIAALISQKFTEATVRTRVSRIYKGTDESCFNEAIRARLGLDEVEDGEEGE